MPFHSISEVKRANERLGHFFFDAGSKRFFDSRIGRTLYGGRYFVTSEQFHGSEGSAPRAYTVREAREDGGIETVGEFQAYETREAAIAAIESLLEDEPVTGDPREYLDPSR